jgi:hypothetical protein
VRDDREPRELWQLARTLDGTAVGHDNAARLMRPYDEDLANGLVFLAAAMRETASQIRQGRYGPPGREPAA